MPRYPKKATYIFTVQKDGKEVNVEDLSEEEQFTVKRWAYQTLVRGLGYRPVDEVKGKRKSE